MSPSFRPIRTTPRLEVTLTNRGGGIGRVVVLVNGKELTADARPRGADADAAKLDLQLDLSSDPRLVPGQQNRVEVLAYNAEGYLSSRGIVNDVRRPRRGRHGRADAVRRRRRRLEVPRRVC